jgi:hypothetical protein
MPNPSMDTIVFQEGIRAFLMACAGIIAAWIGLKIYFRQKEYELIKQRYLENSLDIISAELEFRYNALSHNWQVCIEALERIKLDHPAIKPIDFQKYFIDFPEIKFLQAPHARLKSLTKTDAYKNSYLNALINFQLANDFITKDIPSHIEKFEKGEIRESADKFHHLAISRARVYVQRAFEHRKTIDSLQSLTSELEAVNLGRKDISTFPERKKVKTIIENMNLLSKELLSENRPKGKLE